MSRDTAGYRGMPTGKACIPCRQNRAGIGTDSPADFHVACAPAGKATADAGPDTRAGFPCLSRPRETGTRSKQQAAS